VCVDDIAGTIVNANHEAMRSAVKLCVTDCVDEGVWPIVPQAAKWQRIGDEIEAAMIFTRADFVNVDKNRDVSCIGWSYPRSLLVIMATRWPRTLAMARSSFVGCNSPRGPAMVVAPYGVPPRASV
jgi:hypothetical protein